MARRPRTTRNRTAREMYPLIERYLQGRDTQRAFCAEHDLPLSVFSYWLASYRREHDLAPGESFRDVAGDGNRTHASAFVEVTPPAMQAAAPPAVPALLEIVYPHGVHLRLFAPVEPAFLHRLIGFDQTAQGA